MHPEQSILHPSKLPLGGRTNQRLDPEPGMSGGRLPSAELREHDRAKICSKRISHSSSLEHTSACRLAVRCSQQVKGSPFAGTTCEAKQGHARCHPCDCKGQQ